MNKHHRILFDNKRISWFIVANLGCAFFIFMSGYFLGKRSVLERFSQTTAPGVTLEQSSYENKGQESKKTIT